MVIAFVFGLAIASFYIILILSFSFCLDKMTDLSVAEKKKLMMEVRAAGGASMIKSDSSRLEIWASKKRKGVGSKATSSTGDP